MTTERPFVGLKPVTLRTETVVSSIHPISIRKSRFVPLGLFSRERRLLQGRTAQHLSHDVSVVDSLGKSLRRRLRDAAAKLSDMLPQAHVGRRRLHPRFV